MTPDNPRQIPHSPIPLTSYFSPYSSYSVSPACLAVCSALLLLCLPSLCLLPPCPRSLRQHRGPFPRSWRRTSSLRGPSRPPRRCRRCSRPCSASGPAYDRRNRTGRSSPDASATVWEWGTGKGQSEQPVNCSTLNNFYVYTETDNKCKTGTNF